MAADPNTGLMTLQDALRFTGLSQVDLYRIANRAHLWRYRMTPSGPKVTFRRDELRKMMPPLA